MVITPVLIASVEELRSIVILNRVRLFAEITFKDLPPPYRENDRGDDGHESQELQHSVIVNCLNIYLQDSGG